MTRRSRQPAQLEVILECWEKLDAESLGRQELELICNELRKTFEVALSPAAIARTLADQGVALSHPDVLETDAIWREHQLLEIVPADLETIDSAFAAIENLRSAVSAVQANDFDRFRFKIRQVQEELALFANSEISSTRTRAVAGELSAWLTVWLQNPAVFDDWLALRRNSPEFLQKFA